MTTRLEAIEARNHRVGQTQSKVRWPRPDIEVLTRDDVPLLLSVVRAAAELPPGFLYSLAKDMRRRGGQVEMQLADAIEAVAKAIAPLLEEVRE